MEIKGKKWKKFKYRFKLLLLKGIENSMNAITE